MQIARLTTPTITYKPQAVEVANVTKIFLILRQGSTVIEKDIDTAVITADGFQWTFTQEETRALKAARGGYAKIDYLAGETRYTTDEFPFEVVDSAKDEVIE